MLMGMVTWTSFASATNSLFFQNGSQHGHPIAETMVFSGSLLVVAIAALTVSLRQARLLDTPYQSQEFSPYDVELKTRLMLLQVINKGILLPIAIPIAIPIPMSIPIPIPILSIRYSGSR